MDMERINEAAKYVLSKTHVIPKIAIVLGSGLGEFAHSIEEKVEIPYATVPDFPVSTAPGHEGKFVFGKLKDKYIIAMQGRFHYYEGYSMREVAMPVWVLRKMGVETIIITNAAGAINSEFDVGDLMLVSDHIKLTGENPLRGMNFDEFGSRFNDMSYAYTPELIEIAKQESYGVGLNLREGVYAYMTGPCYETPAEIRMLHVLGADVVGMSTVPEVIVASHCGMKVLAISCVTNMAAGVLEQPLTHEEVIRTGEAIKEKFGLFINRIVERLK